MWKGLIFYSWLLHKKISMGDLASSGQSSFSFKIFTTLFLTLIINIHKILGSVSECHTTDHRCVKVKVGEVLEMKVLFWMHLQLSIVSFNCNSAFLCQSIQCVCVYVCVYVVCVCMCVCVCVTLCALTSDCEWIVLFCHLFLFAKQILRKITKPSLSVCLSLASDSS